MKKLYSDKYNIISVYEKDITIEGILSKGEYQFDTFIVAHNDISIEKITFTYLPSVKTDVVKLSVSANFLNDMKDLWQQAKKSFHWIPNIKLESDNIANDHVFRSPALIATAEDFCAALVPDLNEMKINRTVPHFLDMDYSGPIKLEYGITPSKPYKHVYYKPTGESFSVDQKGVSFSFYMITSDSLSSSKFLKAVTDFQWETFSKNYVNEIMPQTVPFEKYARYGNSMALRYLWQEGKSKDTGGIVLTTFKDEDGITGGREYKNDIWFNTWFNNMRTAWGLYEFGDLLGVSDWKQKSVSIAKLLVEAPMKDGIFPVIYAPFDEGWISSSKQGGGKDMYSLPDCAWSAIWLRRFINNHVSIDGALNFLKEFRSFLYTHQNKSGGFPCWVSKESLAHDERLNDTASEALCLWFLGEELLSGSLTPGEEKKVLEVLSKGAKHLTEKVIEQNLFEDFELYYSCSRKPLDFYDENTCLYGQNTLAIQWCAEFFRVMHLITKDISHYNNACFCVDLLCLYQQIWNPPYLSLYAFGGFGVMNTDGEWNDARQAQFAETLMNFYDLTGDFKYFERGVAAAKASFALMAINENRQVCPNNYLGIGVFFEVHGGSAENYGHGGTDSRSYQSGFHWGTGSALTTAAHIKKKYGDIFIDVKSKKAMGIDGIKVVDTNFNGNVIKLSIDTLAAIDEFYVKLSANFIEYSIYIDGYNLIKSEFPDKYKAKLRGI